MRAVSASPGFAGARSNAQRCAGWIAGLTIAWSATAAAQAGPDMEKARSLYAQANAEMTAGKFTEAARDYSGAYDITKDPILFFKIGSANDKAGRCDLAVVYFSRFLKEGTPKPEHAALARDRIVACKGVPPDEKPPAPAKPPEPGPQASGPRPQDEPKPTAAPSEPAPAAVRSPQPAVRTHTGAWLLVGGAIGFATAGAVLAYSANSSEQDLKDLYAGINNMPVAYDGSVPGRYHDLIDQGHRYQYLSWTAFGLAGACAAGATFLFLRHGGDDEHLSIAPVVTPHESGVMARVRF